MPPSSQLDNGALLEELLVRVKELGPQDEFSQRVYLEVLRLLPAAPNIPGLDIFCELGHKCVPLFVDYLLIRDGKVLLTFRKDKFFTGWHVPGFFRVPNSDLLTQCQKNAKRELGDDVEIINVTPFDFVEQRDCPRFHHATEIVRCEFTGNPEGQWFARLPTDIIPLHRKYGRLLASIWRK